MKKRFSEQQILGFLKEAEAGMPVKELCRKHGFSDAGVAPVIPDTASH
ncbi:transposase [Pandoraea horticolens]|uniref:Transposase n=1 Tax=Pandoraea horticolens TaxID=2508298 RepID=A0A5E4XSA2_9BURK|nr:transposase [Pandoraea horticolens]